MARHRRLIVPGVALHVRQRGVDGMACFREETDRLVYLSALRELIGKARCALHAYCLMTNHVHLLVTPTDETGCSIFMRELGRRYVPYYNNRYGRTGTLWDGRFRSCLVESREYVLACYRYIERNPVRAGMVASPSAYRWSSFKANIGEADDRALCGHAEYTALGFDAALREATNAGLPLVGSALRSRLEASGCRVARGKPGPPGDKRCGRTPVAGELQL